MNLSIVTEELPMTPSVNKIMLKAFQMSKKCGRTFVGPTELISSFLVSPDLPSETKLLLKTIGVDIERASDQMRGLLD